MLAQIIGTLLHLPILLFMVKVCPEDPVTAIGLATTFSSFVKLVAVLLLGLCSKEVRQATIWPYFQYSTAATSADNNSR